MVRKVLQIMKKSLSEVERLRLLVAKQEVEIARLKKGYGYKKAVVSSDLPAFTQFVKEGKTGYISEAGNPDSLAQAMERAIKDCNRLSDMGEAGYDLVKQTLNWDNLAKKIVDKCY